MPGKASVQQHESKIANGKKKLAGESARESFQNVPRLRVQKPLWKFTYLIHRKDRAVAGISRQSLVLPHSQDESKCMTGLSYKHWRKEILTPSISHSLPLIPRVFSLNF